MQDKYKLKCPICKSTLDLHIGFDGCDWESVQGRDSGFDFRLDLACGKCGRVAPVGRLKSPQDFSENLEKYRPYGSGTIERDYSTGGHFDK